MTKTYSSGYIIPDQRDEPPREEETEIDRLEAQLQAAHVAGDDALYEELWDKLHALRRQAEAFDL